MKGPEKKRGTYAGEFNVGSGWLGPSGVGGKPGGGGGDRKPRAKREFVFLLPAYNFFNCTFSSLERL